MSKERLYRRTDVVSFRTTSGIHGGLSNMAPGFPVIVNDTRIRSIEALYQALRFPHIPDAQREIIQQHSPMTAKMVSRRFIDQTREDWDEVKIPIMRWCLRLKLAQNWEAFSAVLLATGNQPIVEDSRKDPFWGAVPKPGEQLEGQNVLGRLLMELREKLRTAPESLHSVPVPNFGLARLVGEEIRVDRCATETGDPVLDLASENLPRKAVASSDQSLPNGSMSLLPKRLIEVDLPIKRISAHARREKSIRHGHISTLHIWWARRPLAACRAVICAALWPDPADPKCPVRFLSAAKEQMLGWTTIERQVLMSAESRTRFEGARRQPSRFDEPRELRQALLDFIADFANWDNSTSEDFLTTSCALTKAAHEALGGEPHTLPLVVDPFAGGGSIPLEALRVGADAFASDLNPVPVLLNKVVLEYIPKHGAELAEHVRKWGKWIKSEAERELGRYYPKDANGASPIAYLWARTIQCEGPGCGAEVPLLRSLWLTKKSNRSVALQIQPNVIRKRVDFAIIVSRRGEWVSQDNIEVKVPNPSLDGTVKRGSATCPCCGFTTPVARVKEQLRARAGGASDARLYCVVTNHADESGRSYRLPVASDIEAANAARNALAEKQSASTENLSLVPNERLDPRGIRHTWAMIYGLEDWSSLYSPRQSLALITIVDNIKLVYQKIEERDLAAAVVTCLAFGLSRLADRCTTLCTWDPTPAASGILHTFARQAIPMVWDFAEGAPLEDRSGGWLSSLDWVAVTIEHCSSVKHAGHVERATATRHPLPDASANCFITDPPYYDAVPYAYLADFFYVWLRRALIDVHGALLADYSVPKDEEIVVDRPHELSSSDHDVAYYERELTKAFDEGRRILAADGIGTVVFASKTTSSWEALLKAIVDANLIVTASWPIDTEMQNRVSAQGQARLASSVHLVCRPRETSGRSTIHEIGDWRDVLQELPQRIHEWMPRLAEEGVVGADAIFACLGPALEIFSRHKRVERADGTHVSLREYLEHVWAAVSKEALSMVFQGADATGFEEDSRLTAMWLWTLNSGVAAGSDRDGEPSDDEEDKPAKPKPQGGFKLEYDAARKIAQGLGAHLEDMNHLVEIAGDTARLLPVAERTSHLFGKEQASAPITPKGIKRDDQLKLDLFHELVGSPEADVAWGEKAVTKPGETTLDRVHQSMILFAAGRGEALRRFLVDDGAGRDQRFWRLAQALSALYPKAVEEKRWIDGVLARKKGLGL